MFPCQKGALMVIAALFLCTSVQAGPVDAGVSWLTQQAQRDGSYSTPLEVATSFQATAESVRALRLLGQSSGLASAEGFFGCRALSRHRISGP